jgi:hypothetical protein
MFCWHKWGKWSPVWSVYGGNVYQSRRCIKCGKITDRKLGFRNTTVADLNQCITDEEEPGVSNNTDGE